MTVLHRFASLFISITVVYTKLPKPYPSYSLKMCTTWQKKEKKSRKSCSIFPMALTSNIHFLKTFLFPKWNEIYLLGVVFILQLHFTSLFFLLQFCKGPAEKFQNHRSKTREGTNAKFEKKTLTSFWISLLPNSFKFTTPSGTNRALCIKKNCTKHNYI